MITLTKNNAKERCRTCLRKLIKNELGVNEGGNNFVCIQSNSELWDLLDKYVGIEGGEEAYQDEDYPSNVCIECLRHLHTFEAFRNKALDSAEKLFQVFRATAGATKIELDDDGVESKVVIQEQLRDGKTNDNDIFNLLVSIRNCCAYINWRS